MDPVIRNTFSCPKKWADMEGAGERKFCPSCNKHVFDLREKTIEEIVVEFGNQEFCGVIQFLKIP